MLNIRKSKKIPPLLKKHRAQKIPGPLYNNGPSGMIDEIKEYLLKEQFYLCCYCMQPISLNSVQVEHKLSQKNHKTLQLNYDNMHGVCSCSKGRKQKEQYCDIFKGDKDFNFDLSSIEKHIRYSPQGKISSSDGELNDALDTILNLNFRDLMSRRKKVVDAIFNFFEKRNLSKPKLKKKISEFKSPDSDGKKEPFCGVALYFLHKRYEKMSSQK